MLAMPRVLGYADPLSVAPGETIRFMVGTLDGPRRYRAEVVRVVCGDTGPGGPKTVRVPTPVDGEHQGTPQHLDAGSYVIVERPDAFAGLRRFTLEAIIQPTRVPVRPTARPQVIMGTWAEDARAGFALMLDEAGALAVLAGAGGGREPASATTGVPLTPRRWYQVGAVVDLAAGTVTLSQTPLAEHTPSAERPLTMDARIPPMAPPPAGAFFLAAARRGTEDGRLRTMWHFNGKIDRPRVVGDEAPLAVWDLAADIAGDRVTDRSTHALHGRTVNAPKRAVTGHNWDGSEMDWRRAPEQYGAIHFHDDDLHDAAWRPSLRWTVPADTRSGVYALRLEAEGGPEFWVVFYVRPPRNGPRARAAFLASTATYLAYSNYRARMRPGPSELYIGALPMVDGTDILLMHHPELGGSSYDTHSDGSGVCHVSRLRPIVNTRPTGWLWNLFLDFCLLDWLEATGQPYDVVTDDDLHAEGADLLAPYTVVLTGCHPEYYSREMLDALERYLGRGGRLMYMGGNGFYWRVSYPPAQPGLLEVRRAEDGTRAWVEAVGEYYHSSTGEYGGLWRRQGRPPNMLAGVGFVAQGFDRSSYYRRTGASRDPRVTFMFEGVADEVLGDFGHSGSGAAGLELDAFSTGLGSPAHALVVATSEDHSNAFQLVNEEMNVSFAGADGRFSPAVRADIVFFEHPGGGAVFSTGSIAYVGSLDHNGYDNNIARLTGNVLRRFLDGTPFVMPSARPA
ncbi:MAG TPA: N,N-dimethylformamidase beta subunit family domain-containing protein [Verrucomicrobiae bacterium]|jgi:N,N-dimethylformamidase beta subunit-like protein|nr:N,N-dimethylformamidase beta subunit family domain-containing protein [Verrucomicrobiae bacterium]